MASENAERQARIVAAIGNNTIPTEHVALAGFLGDKDAQKVLEPWRDYTIRDVQHWCELFQMAIHEDMELVYCRLILSWARKAREVWDSEALTAAQRAMKIGPHHLLQLSEEAVRNIAEDEGPRLQMEHTRLADDPEHFKSVVGFERHAHILTLALSVGDILLLKRTPREALFAAGQAAQALWPGQIEMLTKVAGDELIPWLLNEDDPLAAAPTQLPQD